MNRLMTDGEILNHFSAGHPVMDVRAPIEFSEGALPQSFNLPLLNDVDRAHVGTTYKNEGAEAALKLGHELISGEVREQRLAAWRGFLDENPTAAVMCFRGGQRSQLVQSELKKMGFDVPLIEGGFKRVRRLLRDEIDRACESKSWRVLSGFTGTGKTRVLRSLAKTGTAFLDLEHAARHRGSSFGTWPLPQPTPVTFESELGLASVRIMSRCENEQPVWLEDESRSIGKLVLPPPVFRTLSASKVWVLEKPRSERAARLTEEYLTENYGLKDGSPPTTALSERVLHDIRRAILNIERRLGGAETKKLLDMIDEAAPQFTTAGTFSAHWPWVERVLETYYDPLYEKHLAQIADRVIGRGPEDDFRAFVQS